MKTGAVWKYELSPAKKRNTIEMPIGARVLTVQMQGDAVCIWAMVDPNAAKARRTFYIFGTGHEIDEPDELQYVGTFQPNEGGSPLVFHVFEDLGVKV
jgi:hypothetical protein